MSPQSGKTLFLQFSEGPVTEATFPMGAGAQCAACGFRYWEYRGHIIPCPLCEADRLDKLVNSPEIADFLKGVRLEAAHQVERWGEAQDREKSAENWFWLVGYLAGKALRAVITGDRDKALHHTISSAAALFNWHRAIQQDTTGAGIGADPEFEEEPMPAVFRSNRRAA